MYPCHVIQRLRNSYPPWQHRYIRNETHFAHQHITLCPRIASQHLQISLKLREPQNCVQRGALPRSVRSDQSQDPPLFYPQVHTIQRDGSAEGLAQSACFDHCHCFCSSSFFGFTPEVASLADASRVAAACSSSSGVSPSR